jgi:hypothetical protein
MKSCFGIAAVIALPALSGTAWAGGSEDLGCSNATLQGAYAFGVTNYAFPLVVAGIKVFDGRGNFTQRDYGGDSVPVLTTRAGKGHLHCGSRLHREPGAQLECAWRPRRHLARCRKGPVCDQRRWPPCPRSRLGIHPSWILRAGARPNERRRLEGRLGAGRVAARAPATSYDRSSLAARKTHGSWRGRGSRS